MNSEVGMRNAENKKITTEAQRAQRLYFFPLPGDGGKGKTICRIATIVLLNTKHKTH